MSGQVWRQSAGSGRHVFCLAFAEALRELAGAEPVESLHARGDYAWLYALGFDCTSWPSLPLGLRRKDFVWLKTDAKPRRPDLRRLPRGVAIAEALSTFAALLRSNPEKPETPKTRQHE